MKRHRTQSGFTLLEVLGILSIVFVLALFMLPRMARAKCKCGLRCINNLKQVSLSFKQWSLDNNDRFPWQVSTNDGGAKEWIGSGSVWQYFLVMSNELNTPKVLICPQDPVTQRWVANSFTFDPNIPGQSPFTNNNNVSYFVGVDAMNVQPAMFLTGDANLTLHGKPVKPGLLLLRTNNPVAWTEVLPHHGQGANIALVDGSVTSCADAGLRQLLKQSRVETNRLAIP